MNIYDIKVGDHVQISGKRYLISYRIEQLHTKKSRRTIAA